MNGCKITPQLINLFVTFSGIIINTLFKIDRKKMKIHNENL